MLRLLNILYSRALNPQFNINRMDIQIVSLMHSLESQIHKIWQNHNNNNLIIPRVCNHINHHNNKDTLSSNLCNFLKKYYSLKT